MSEPRCLAASSLRIRMVHGDLRPTTLSRPASLMSAISDCESLLRTLLSQYLTGWVGKSEREFAKAIELAAIRGEQLQPPTWKEPGNDSTCFRSRVVTTENEREFFGEDVVVVDFKRQRVELLNPAESVTAVVEAMRKGGGVATTWRRLLLGGVLGLPESRNPAATGDLLEAVFEVASRPEFQLTEKEVPPVVIRVLTAARARQGVPPERIEEELARLRRPSAGRVQAARFQAEVLRQAQRIRDRRRREGLIRRRGRTLAEKIGSRTQAPEVVLAKRRREEWQQRLMAELRESAPPAVQRIISLVQEKDLSVAEACRQLGVDRVRFESWVNSVQRRLCVRRVKKMKSLTTRRPKAS